MTIQNPHTSTPGNVSEIQRLTAEADRLSHTVDSWNMWYIGFGFAALVIAFWVFFAQWRIIARGRELSAVQSDLIAAKDRELHSDLIQKDFDISKANQSAADAQKQAGESNKIAALATERAGKAEASLALAEQHSAEANAKAERSRRDAAKANEASARAQAQVAEATKRAAEATKDAETEKIERLKLEAQIAPRRLTIAQSEAIAKASRRFAGRSVRVESYALDGEGAVLAKQLIAALSAGGITVQDATASYSPLGGFVFGVHANGDDPTFVKFLADTLSLQGQLLVSPPNSPMPPTMGMSAMSPNEAHTEATILVGLKPTQ